MTMYALPISIKECGFYPYLFSLVFVMSLLVMLDLKHCTWMEKPRSPKQFQISAPETLLPALAGPGGLSWSLILCSHHLFLRGS